MQAPRTSTKAVDAMDDLIETSRRIHADARVDPHEEQEFNEALIRAAYEVGKSDAQVDLAMVGLKSGANSDRYKQVERAFRKTYGTIVDFAAYANKRSDRGHDPSAA